MVNPPALPKHARVVVVGGGIIGTLRRLPPRSHGLEGRRAARARPPDRRARRGTPPAHGHVRLDLRDLDARCASTRATSTRGSRPRPARRPASAPIGFIEVAADKDRLEEYRRVSAFNRYCGIDVHEISPREVKDLFPLAKVDDILAGFYVRKTAASNPVDVTMALAKGARMRGATIFEGVPRHGRSRRTGAVTGVDTPHGDIEAEYVVNCAGMWARAARRAVGRQHPAAVGRALLPDHRADPGPAADWPVLEDPGSYGYFREEVGGLMVGLFEPVCAPWKVDGVPEDFSFGEIPPDWDRMGPYVEKAMARVPISIDRPA